MLPTILQITLAALLLATQAHAAPGVCRAIDGDTLVCNKERVRLEHVDAPELHARCKKEMDAAQAAKLFSQLALDGANSIEIFVDQRRARDRYGRTLARVSVDGKDLGSLLEKAGLARPYHGERRQSWCD